MEIKHFTLSNNCSFKILYFFVLTLSAVILQLKNAKAKSENYPKNSRYMYN